MSDDVQALKYLASQLSDEHLGEEIERIVQRVDADVLRLKVLTEERRSRIPVLIITEAGLAWLDAHQEGVA